MSPIPIINKPHCALLLTLLMLTATNSQAEISPQRVMTFEQCVKAVSEKNADLLTAAANVENMKALSSGAYSGFFPQLSAAAGYTDSSVSGNVPTPGAITQSVTVQNQYSESLSLNQSLFNGFSDMGKAKQGAANLEAAKAQLALAKVTLSATLKTAFAQLLFEQQSVDLTEAILKRQQNNLRMINLTFKGGNENKGNLLFQQATVSQASYQHDHAIRQLKNAVLQLGVLWGAAPNDIFKVAGELGGHAPVMRPDFEGLALAHPNHVNFAQQRMSADAGVMVADGAWYPNVNLIGSIGDVGSSWPPDQQRWSVGVSLTFPFFPGTSAYYNSQSARALKRQAEFTEHSTDFKLVAAMENAYEGLLDAVTQVQVAEDFKLAAQERSIIANGKYKSGLLTFEDWTLIDQDLVTREQNLLNSQLSAMQAEATWDSAIGRGDIQ